MADGVVITSMREASERVTDAKVADVKALFDTHVNDGKVIVVVEGQDDTEVYEKVMDVNAVCWYVDCNCDKHCVILDALNGRYGKRLLAIKDADFDRLEGTTHPYPNMMLTDTHDMEGMIVSECLSELQGEDAIRCQGVNLSEVYTELEDISYLKWFNHANHHGINFSESALDLDINIYFDDCISKTESIVNVTLSDMYEFKKAHLGVSVKELCNGHDIFERIYIRAKAANVVNYAKKPFFRRLRRAYPKDKFVTTALFQSIKIWEISNDQRVLAVA
jgi:hypothetical protein